MSFLHPSQIIKWTCNLTLGARLHAIYHKGSKDTFNHFCENINTCKYIIQEQSNYMIKSIKIILKYDKNVIRNRRFVGAFCKNLARKSFETAESGYKNSNSTLHWCFCIAGLIMKCMYSVEQLHCWNDIKRMLFPCRAWAWNKNYHQSQSTYTIIINAWCRNNASTKNYILS